MHDGRPQSVPIPFLPEQILGEIGRLDPRFPEILVSGLAEEALRRVSARAEPWRNTAGRPSSEDLETFCKALVANALSTTVTMPRSFARRHT